MPELEGRRPAHNGFSLLRGELVALVNGSRSRAGQRGSGVKTVRAPAKKHPEPCPAKALKPAARGRAAATPRRLFRWRMRISIDRFTGVMGDGADAYYLCWVLQLELQGVF